jgi:dTDP-4-dehydrorhamnose 3,5-epimerase
LGFTFTPVPGLPEVVRIDATRHGDDRGWFSETYKRSALESASIRADFRQDNHSFSRRAGTLRGLHFQAAPATQAKLVRVVSGRIFDVAVDIRPGPTFGRWASVVLDADTPSLLWIPEGFAHGFQTLDADTAVLYKTTAEYSPDHERGVVWSDPTLAIPWPIAEPLLSDRDRRWPTLSTAI